MCINNLSSAYEGKGKGRMGDIGLTLRSLSAKISEGLLSLVKGSTSVKVN